MMWLLLPPLVVPDHSEVGKLLPCPSRTLISWVPGNDSLAIKGCSQAGAWPLLSRKELKTLEAQTTILTFLLHTLSAA